MITDRRAQGLAGILLFVVVTMVVRADEPERRTPPRNGERVGDRLWIWAHAAGVYNDGFLRRQPGTSTIEPVDAADYMGLRNVMFIRFLGEPRPPFDAYYAPFTKMDKVVWSLTGAEGATSPEERDAVFQLATAKPNISGFILDDFFRGNVTTPPPNDASANEPFEASLTPKELQSLRRRLNVRGKQLPLIAVVYTGQISTRASAHLEHVDQITLWTWEPAGLKDLETNLTRLERLVPEKKILLGCYMFDFSASQPLPVELMQRQTELGLKWLQAGRIEGIVFLATPVCDLKLDSVEWTRRWVAKVGDQLLKRKQNPAADVPDSN